MVGRVTTLVDFPKVSQIIDYFIVNEYGESYRRSVIMPSALAGPQESLGNVSASVGRLVEMQVPRNKTVLVFGWSVPAQYIPFHGVLDCTRPLVINSVVSIVSIPVVSVRYGGQPLPLPSAHDVLSVPIHISLLMSAFYTAGTHWILNAKQHKMKATRPYTWGQEATEGRAAVYIRCRRHPQHQANLSLPVCRPRMVTDGLRHSFGA